MLEYQLFKQQPDRAADNVLLVFHGLGADKYNLDFLFNLWPDCGLHAYFFQAPLREESFFGQKAVLASWFNLLALDSELDKATQQRLVMLQHCHDIVQKAHRSDVPIHVAGFSQGGVMALAMTEHLQCASVALMSTFWPQPRLPNISGQPDFFQSHGYKDTVVPIKHGHKIAALLKDKGYFLQHCFEESLDHDISLETENNYRLFIKKILKKTENR